MKKEIAEKIIKELDKRNMKIADLARAIGVSATTIENWLSFADTSWTMSSTNLIKICKVFKISADYLLGLEK